MSELTPITRVESYLDAIVNNGIPPTEDITRIETFLQAIYDNQVCALTPITRIEMFLGKISGQDIVLPEPITRIELYLAAIAGEDVELPEMPITRIEMYLAEWADSGDWTTISGAIVEFIAQRAHKLKSCVVSLSPIQDLHGYDSPWPPGGGKNLLRPTPRTVTSKGITYTANEDGSITLTGTATGDENFTVVSGDASAFPAPLSVLVTGGPSVGISFEIGGVLVSANNGTYTFTSEIQKNTTSIRVASGTVTNCTIKIQAENSSTIPTKWTPYSNICPISGWTGCEVTRTGKNIWNKDDPSAEFGYYAIDGEFVPYSAYRCLTYPCRPGDIFTKSGTGWGGIVTYWNNGTFVASVNSQTVTVPSGVNQVKFACLYSSADAQLELGSTATDYEPYKGNSYSVTWEDEVYGANPDIVSGEMPVTRGNIVYDGSADEDIRLYSGQRFTLGCSDYKSPATSVVDSIMCNRLKTVSKGQQGSGLYLISGSDGGLNQFMINVRLQTVADVRAWLAENPLQVNYPLAAPIETTITPTSITALKGYNAMWSNGGDIEVTVHGTSVEVETLQALNMLLGGAYHNNQTAEDVSDDEALDIILGGDNK